ncbi:MAG: class I SAM-dependent methyltransferase [Bacteroidia bacterium]
MLKTHQDAYGNNIYDTFVHKKGGYDIIEREDGHFSLNGDSNAYTIPFEEWDEIQQIAAAFVKGRVLDVGCGGGKHSIYFQSKGCDVLGIDNSPLAIEVCKLRGLKKTKVCNVSEISPELGVFDTILMMGNNFGLVENAEKGKALFHTLYEMTSPDAAILAETLDPYGKAFDNESDCEYLQWNRVRGRLSGQLRVRVRYGKYATPWADYLFVSLAEMKEILKGTGWEVVETFDDPNIDQYIAFIQKIKR